MKTEAGTTSEQYNRLAEVGIARHPQVIQDLRGLFVAELKQLYYAERILESAILRIASEVFSRKLADNFADFQKMVRTQAARVDIILSRLDEHPHGGHSATIEVLIRETESTLGRIPKGPVYDAAAILAVQKFHHFMITTYGTLWAFSKAMGEAVAARLLEEALVDERNADEALSVLAMNDINTHAANFRYRTNS